MPAPDGFAYTDKRLEDLRRELSAETKRLDERWTREEHAKILAQQNLDARLSSMNELRGQLDRQAGTFITRDALEAALLAVIHRIDALEKKAENWQGRGWGIWIAIIIAGTVNMAALGLLFQHLSSTSR